MSKKQSKVKDVEAGEDKVEESKELLEKKKGENVEATLCMARISKFCPKSHSDNNLHNTYILKTFIYLLRW